MPKVLILCEDYPSEKNLYPMAFVHSRNIEYIKYGIKVDVLNFSAKEDYIFEGVHVKSTKSLLKLDMYDAIMSHAPNIRNHIMYLIPRMKYIRNLVFVFHGHEVLKINKYYPTPYNWEKKSSLFKVLLQLAYDNIKLVILKNFINFHSKKIKLIFVSQWMRDNAFICMGKPKTKKIFIIHNLINQNFINNKFDSRSEKKGDFVTIRPLNGSKYAVDLVVDFAKNNPHYNFTIYGVGNLFEYIAKPNNVTHIHKFIHQKDIPEILNQYKYAIMPTRLDAQGVMMCEIASYGMPIIVSDLPICREMLGQFNNCLFIKNSKFNEFSIDDELLLSLTSNNIHQVNRKFLSDVLVKKEINVLFQEVL